MGLALSVLRDKILDITKVPRNILEKNVYLCVHPPTCTQAHTHTHTHIHTHTHSHSHTVFHLVTTFTLFSPVLGEAGRIFFTVQRMASYLDSNGKLYPDHEGSAVLIALAR